MNDLDLCSEVVSRSRQPLHYIWRWISQKPWEIEAWFQRTTNRKWPMGYQMVTWPMTSRDPQRCCEAVGSAILATAWHLVRFVTEMWSCDATPSAVELAGAAHRLECSLYSSSGVFMVWRHCISPTIPSVSPTSTHGGVYAPRLLALSSFRRRVCPPSATVPFQLLLHIRGTVYQTLSRCHRLCPRSNVVSRLYLSLGVALLHLPTPCIYFATPYVRPFVFFLSK